MDLKHQLCFESFKVKIGIRTNDADLIDLLKKSIPEILPIERREISPAEAVYWFSVSLCEDAKNEFFIYKGSELLANKQSPEEVLNFLESQIRTTVAEFAKDIIFLHAGAVSWKGKAIVMPGKSFSGKTTLVRELIKRDCDYLSDEFAVIDINGLVHPFPKKLSLRGIIDDFQQVDFGVEELGGKRRRTPVPIGFLLVTEYKKENKKPNLRIDRVGEGVMASLANSLSIRQNPKFVLEILGIVAQRVTVFQAERGDAGEFADFFLDYLVEIENSKIKTAENF